ncbi:NDP-sugar synthase [Methylotenera sp.]|uniref:NDP-sugar synthase n=1 Tax=Methylotenera sp. TaxID=2051956 RepID=UPI0027317E5E|nr:NDP-sugar synthase [Methylotenera sp.]MDP2071317.1 NDP-sugar synthase [Methylotenera sp.]MDP2229664.1 NDP-sugar synthase [Methylotenera sp.]MDP3005234.1 NDP-sugar synthase [Methylotenera sp.]MDP3818136.1 NDP-sugar synthase [Methylotenera sp.]
MKAMILAAGKGTRVRPLTYELPKPMIPLLGKPVMAYLIEHLVKHNISEVMINVSYLHEKIQQYFGDGHRFGIEIGYSFEGDISNGKIIPSPVGSAGGMRKIQDFGGFFNETTIVICGDAIIDLDITAAVAEHRKSGALVSLVAKEVPMDKVSDYGIVLTDDDGKIISFQEKPSQTEARSNLASTGIYIFEPEAIDLIPSDSAFDIGSDLFPLLVEKKLPFYAINQQFNWIDIGLVSDYWKVMQQLLRGEVPSMKMPGKQVKPGVWVGLNVHIDWQNTIIQGPVYIGSGSRIDKGTEILGPTWISDGCHVQRGGRVIRSVLFEYTRVGQDYCFEEMVVCGEYCVDKHGRMIHVDDDACDLIWSDAREKVIYPTNYAQARL